MTELKNKGKELEGAWIHKAQEKVLSFDVRREKYTYMEARKYFADPRMSVLNIQQQQQ